MKTTKQKILAAALTAAVIMSNLLLAACDTESPESPASGKDRTSSNPPAVVNDVFDDTPQPADTNPNTDPDNEPSTDTADSVVLDNVVVVSVSENPETGKVSFSCGAVIEGYPGGYSPFTFAVDAGAIESDEALASIDDLFGKLIKIEYSGIFMESYPMGAAGVTRVIYSGETASEEVFNECLSLFSFDDQSCVQEAYVVDNAYVIRTEEMWDGKNASILAYAQMGTCGMKDLVEIIMPLDRVKDENGNTVSVANIGVGRCIEFAYTDVTENEAGSPVFNVKVDYLTVKQESVEVSEETLNAALSSWAIE